MCYWQPLLTTKSKPASQLQIVRWIRKPMETLWPYVLPLPTDSKRQHQILLSLFKSKVSIDIVRSIPLEEAAYQKAMIKKLPYSNKTIIKWLKNLVSVDILAEGMEKSKHGRAWVKWYRLTPFGKWMKLLLMPPEQVPSERIADLINELFGMYLRSAISLCKRYKIDPEILKTTMNKLYHTEIRRRK